MLGSLRFGGTMEIGGLNEEVNPRRVQGILKSVPRYYPDFTPEDFRDLPVWRGLRPCSPDGLPYLGRTAHYANLAIATGHAMMGLSSSFKPPISIVPPKRRLPSIGVTATRASVKMEQICGNWRGFGSVRL